MDLMSRSNPPVYQNATGEGDNVGRDKYITIYQKLAPEALRKPIELILSSIRERKQDVAKIRLETIKATGLDSNSEAILDMLSIQLNLLEDNETPKIHSSILSTFKSSTDTTIRDLCLATLIRLDVKNNRIEDARERYLKDDTSLSYSQEVFYECVATSKELEQTYEKNRLDLDESQLIGLIRGALRTQLFEFSLTVANRLNEIFPSFNSKVLWLVATACNLEIKLANKHYWIVTASLRAEIIKLIDEVVLLINESKGSDPRLLNIAAAYWHNIRNEHQQLDDICWKYVDEIEKVLPEVATILRRLNNPNELETDDLESKCRKAQNDKIYRNQLLNEVFAKQEISNDDFIIAYHFSDSKILKQWIDSGGKIIGVEDIVADFNYLILLLFALPNKKHPDQREGLKKIKLFAEEIIEKHKQMLPNLHPISLLKIAEHLGNHPKLSMIACDLISPILPPADLWASPIVESYLNTLLVSQQMATLASVLSNINQAEKNAFVWRVQSRLFELHNDYPNAINSIEEALKLDRNVLDVWHSLVILHRKNGISDNELALVLKSIPNELLAKKSNRAISILIEFAKTGGFARAEKIMISWFIKDPNTCATEITDFVNNLLFAHITKDPTDENVGDSIVGIRFKKDNEELTQLLVRQNNSNHPALLDINSDLGKALYQMKVSETKQHGMYDLTLLERLPPYVAAFQISLRLRHTQNNGSDGFYMFSVPNDPEPGELLALLERKLPKNRNDDIFSNSAIPFICKGHFLDRNNPVKAALQQLLTKKPAPCSLPNFGEEDTAEIILDVYAITYLAITGLANGINHFSIKFAITDETRMVIENWLTDGYLPVDPRENVGIWRQSSDNMNIYFQELVKAFRLILNKVEVTKPNLVDMPLFMLSLVEMVDISVYSSMCLSIANNIPWLCIDEIFAHFTIHESGYKQVNAFKLLIELGSLLAFEQKKDGLYLYAEQIIPYALSANDLRLLSISDDEHAHYALAKLIYLHPKAFSNTGSAVTMLTELLVPVLGKAYLDGHILRGLRIHNPSNNGYAEKVFNACCYVSMQCDDVSIAERKLAMFLCKLFIKFNKIPPMIEVLRAMAWGFATGHFMDISMLNAFINEELDGL
ncbi:GapS6b family protein [Methylovulum miyakonense]|uniref:GapS6b family protein n=1 Tax=Methylovulum miyakonense TaxID=645578 RepID=UPI0003817059|nr:hypothetical protein [Methylovulum miyakonense]